MSDQLSPQSEQFITEALAAGLYPSRPAVLEAALLELRAAQEDEEERLRMIDEAVDQADAGKTVPWDPEQFKRLVRERLAALQQAKS